MVQWKDDVWLSYAAAEVRCIGGIYFQSKIDDHSGQVYFSGVVSHEQLWRSWPAMRVTVISDFVSLVNLACDLTTEKFEIVTGDWMMTNGGKRQDDEGECLTTAVALVLHHTIVITHHPHSQSPWPLL